MFKDHDAMRPGATPERVLAVCRLLDGASYSEARINQLLQLTDDPVREEAVTQSVRACEELGLIRKTDSGYTLSAAPEVLATPAAFRRHVAPIIFSHGSSTFFQMTEWFISHADKALELNRFDEYASEAVKDGLSSIKENDVLGWRFWMRFLGHAYQFKRTLIPNMYVRLSDALSSLEPDTHMTCTQFAAWIRTNIPEAASSCTNGTFPLAVSNGLRTLQSCGEIELTATPDAIRIGLYPLKGVAHNDFSDVIIKGVKP